MPSPRRRLKKPRPYLNLVALLPSGDVALRRTTHAYLCLVAYLDGQTWRIARWSFTFCEALKLCRRFRSKSTPAAIIRTYIVD